MIKLAFFLWFFAYASCVVAANELYFALGLHIIIAVRICALTRNPFAFPF